MGTCSCVVSRWADLGMYMSAIKQHCITGASCFGGSPGRARRWRRGRWRARVRSTPRGRWPSSRARAPTASASSVARPSAPCACSSRRCTPDKPSLTQPAPTPCMHTWHLPHVLLLEMCGILAHLAALNLHSISILCRRPDCCSWPPKACLAKLFKISLSLLLANEGQVSCCRQRQEPPQ